jgi:hypothetical protein
MGQLGVAIYRSHVIVLKHLTMRHKIAMHETTLKIKTLVIYISTICFLLTSNLDIYSFILLLFPLL